MNQREFLKILKNEIKNAPLQEKDDLINEYRNHFIESKIEGINENVAAEMLGDPKEIAKEINYTYAINDFKEKPNIKTTLNLFKNIALLSLFHLIMAILLFIIFIFLMPLLLGLLIATPFMLLSPLYLVFLVLIEGSSALSSENVFEVIKGLLLGMILLFMYIYLFRNFKRFFVSFVEWNKHLIKRRS
ncbi:HAAS signaling domain-containing protein [Macrococcus animalis]|uniref:HAAS signaling domain-containing protein n=1 Tax=Macrococcus animalis TaxID=3395467 RepID=UPI0039BE4CFA